MELNLNVTSLQMKNGLNQRVFDVPAAGAFLLTDLKESLWEVFEPGEVAVFQDIGEARELLTHYGAHPEARRSMIGRARERVLARHTYLHRVRSICSRLEKGFFSRPLTSCAQVPAFAAIPA